MRRNITIFKRITCVLGILFIVLGVIPIPAVSVISEVSANTTTSNASTSHSLPKFSSIKLNDVLNQDEGGEPAGEGGGEESSPTEEAPAENLPPVEISPEPTVEPPAAEETQEATEEASPTDVPTEEPTEEVGAENGEVNSQTFCTWNGGYCNSSWECCSGNCKSHQCQCKSDNQSCSSSGQCCSGTCYAGKCTTCAAYQACPTECGQPAQDLPNGFCGTHHCDATAACACVEEEGFCDLNHTCCDGLTCNGNKCKVSTHACKTEGMPCGGNNVCCDGLICQDQAGSEPDKCVSAATPVDCVGSWGDCEGDCGTTGTKTFTITTPAENGGVACEAADGATQSCTTDACPPEEDCPTTCGLPSSQVPDGHGGLKTCPATAACPVDCVLGDYGPCSATCGGGTQTQIIQVPAQNGGSCNPDTRACNTDPCPINCVGSWGECEGECGITTGSQTFTITTAAQYGGTECEAANGATSECTTDPCPEDCVGSWGECVGNCGEEGTQTFTITKAAVNGGTECPYTDGATQACTMDPCPIDCQWSEWSECDAQCGTGTQTREISIQAENGGAECEGLAEQECYAGDCPTQLVLDPTCVTGHLGNARLAWSFTNPSSKSVPVSWSLDGHTGSGTIGPHDTINVGQTTDGPTYHSLTVYWPGGSATASSSHDCDGGVGSSTTTTGTGGGPGGIIPVTGGAGGPTEDLLIIPVTGVDLGNQLAGLQKLFLYMGLMMFGVTMVLEGVTKKYTI